MEDNANKPELPEQLTRGVPRHEETGECFWPHERVVEAIHQLSSMGYAVVSAELSAIVDGTLTPGRAPGASGDDLFVVFDAEDRGQSESWKQYVNRCRDDLVNQIQTFDAPNKTDPNRTERILYCLTYVTEEEFNEMEE